MIKLEKIFVLLFLLGLSVRMSAVGLDKSISDTASAAADGNSERERHKCR